MTNTVELEVYIVRAGLTKQEIAKRLGISGMSFYRKLNNLNEFKASEIDMLVKMLGITDMDKIFFNKGVD